MDIPHLLVGDGEDAVRSFSVELQVTNGRFDEDNGQLRRREVGNRVCTGDEDSDDCQITKYFAYTYFQLINFGLSAFSIQHSD